jgi:flagellar hook protein FlgE
MSLQGTFNTAVQAMQSQSQNLSNISTNVANVNTTAYKLQGSHFATLLNHITPSSGGDKRFFTVNTYDYREVTKQGQIATTQRSFDVAINGRGFLVTNTSQEGGDGTGDPGIWQYTRDGSFFGQAVELETDTDGNGQNDQGTLLTTAAGAYVYGWQADEDGNFAPTNSLSSLTPIMFNSNEVFEARPTAQIELQGNLSAVSSGRQNVGLPFVDNAGSSRTLSIGFNASINGEWTLDMSSRATDLQPVNVSFDPPTISFNSIGQIESPPGGQLLVIVDDPSGPQTLNVDLSGLTQFGGGTNLTVQNIKQDGFVAGRLDATYFNKNGVLVGSYTNGEVRNLYKLAIATFAAENNLDAKAGNYFVQSHESGELALHGLGSPTGRTEIVVGALERSNVDLADQFSKMIVTQRAYSSAAKVLTTADEMTQAARDLKR